MFRLVSMPLLSTKHDCSKVEAAISRLDKNWHSNPFSPDFHVNVQGMTRDLAPLIANELYYI
jgi:hypothetical protein